MSGVLNSSHTAGYTWDLSSQNQIAGQPVVESYQRGGMRRKRRGRKSRGKSRRQSRRMSRRQSRRMSRRQSRRMSRRMSRRQSRRMSRRMSRRKSGKSGKSRKSRKKVMKKPVHIPKFEDYDVKPVIGRMRGGAACVHAGCAYLDDKRALKNYINSLDEKTMNKVRIQAGQDEKKIKEILKNMYEDTKRIIRR